VSEIERCADSFSDLIWDNYCRIVESSPSFCSLEDCSILQALKKHLDEDIFYDIITYTLSYKLDFYKKHAPDVYWECNDFLKGQFTPAYNVEPYLWCEYTRNMMQRALLRNKEMLVNMDPTEDYQRLLKEYK